MSTRDGGIGHVLGHASRLADRKGDGPASRSIGCLVRRSGEGGESGVSVEVRMYVYRSSQRSSQHRTRLAYYNKSKVGTIVAPGGI